MKRILSVLVLFAAFAAGAHAQFTANAVRVNQRTADNANFMARDLMPPADDKDGIFVLGGSTKLPLFVTLGPGLSITDAVLNVSATGVNADWNATSGAARILNKPNLSTVGMTGQYGDLLGKPANVSDFTNDAGYTTGAALAAGLAGKDAQGAAAAAQAFAVQRANHTGTQPASTITGLAPVAISGDYNALTNRPSIPAAVPFNFGTPAARTLALSTAHQASDPTRAAVVTVSPQCGATLTLVTGTTCTLQARIGAAGLTCASGTVVATWTNGNTGTLTVGLGLTQTVGAPAALNLPAGAYFALCPTAGTFTIASAVDQSAG